jgi:transposase
MEYDGIPLRAYSVKELAALFDVSRPTLVRWLKPYKSQIGKRIGHFYTLKQVEIIFKSIGWPSRDRKSA